MAKSIVPDALWEKIKPLLPPEPPKPKGGRPRIDDRRALTGILFVLRTGIGWEHLPQEMGCGCGMTCWRRLMEWHEGGVWDALHRLLLEELEAARQIDWSRASLDGSSLPAKGGALRRGRTRRTAANRARSTTSSSMATGSRSASR